MEIFFLVILSVGISIPKTKRYKTVYLMSLMRQLSAHCELRTVQPKMKIILSITQHHVVSSDMN